MKPRHQLEGEGGFCNLPFHRQFIGGPEFPGGLPDWIRLDFSDRFRVAHSPGLNAAYTVSQSKALLILGDILDPRNVSHDNGEVADRLLREIATFHDFEVESAGLAGRWIAILMLDGETRVYPDACGMQSVYSSSLSTRGGQWIASQPALLAGVLGLEPDVELVEEFFRHEHGATWPAGVTPYRQLRHLLPNHCLDLDSGSIQRFWPLGELASVEVDEAVSEIRDLLNGIVASACHRFRVFMPLTGGYDSRALFAASSELRGQMEFFTFRTPQTPHYDRAIPRRIAREYDLELRVLAADPMADEFWEVLRRNVAGMFFDPSLVMFQTYQRLPEGSAVVAGLAAETLRCFYYPDGRLASEYTDRDLCNMTEFRDNPVARLAYAEWLASFPGDSNVALPDLLYWEHRLGGWAALGCLAHDAVTVLIPAYNCRRLLATGLGVSVGFRHRPYELFRRLCDTYAPALARVPYNSGWMDTASEAVRRAIPWRVKTGFDNLRMQAAGLVAGGQPDRLRSFWESNSESTRRIVNGG